MSIILTSDGITSKAIEDALLASLTPGPVTGKSACIVTTASSHKEQSPGAVRTKLFMEHLGFHRVDFLDVQHEDPSPLQSCDVLYLNGGNPFFLLHWMRESGALQLIQSLDMGCQTLIGTSAGALVLAPTLSHLHELNRIVGYDPMDAGALTDYTGAGIIDLNPLPHYNRFLIAQPDVEEELQRLEREWQLIMTRIPDGEAVHVVRGAARKIGNGPIKP